LSKFIDTRLLAFVSMSSPDPTVGDDPETESVRKSRWAGISTDDLTKTSCSSFTLIEAMAAGLMRYPGLSPEREALYFPGTSSQSTPQQKLLLVWERQQELATGKWSEEDANLYSWGVKAPGCPPPRQVLADMD
jgi:hypothetical protein